MAKSKKTTKANRRRFLTRALLIFLTFFVVASGVVLLNEYARIKSQLTTENSRLKTELLSSENKYKSFVKLHTTSDTDEFTNKIESVEVHNLVNQERKKAGLPELSYIPLLETSACFKAEHMIQNNYWAHVAPDGTQPWYFFQQAGVYYDRAGENLAYGFSSSFAVVDGWMHSPTHKANIVGDYSGEGICVRNAPLFQKGKHVVVVQHLYK